MTTNLNEQGFDGPLAWQTPGTRPAYLRWVTWHLAKSLGWVALWWGTLYLTVLLPLAAVVPMTLVLLVIMFLALLAFGRLSRWRRMRRILTTYPWRQQSRAVRITGGKEALFVLPDPDSPEKTVSLKLAAGLFRIWSREALKDYDDELWYAGDPRFACVVAKPGPQSLSCLAQPTAYNPRTSPRRKGLSPEARRRARAIGARVAD
ncbi:hypothetical protein ACFOZ0_33835 [Streptomyces yaanensis]|uniref:Uncharacterized protein n=1 Tax=Streptomyces yaanensis TaxID=1142239 RepID=A0ABV7SPB1_9ACTN|nr:hypothetical protein [Streptomyces sp. CGMCC 4.7035]WNB98141.1 hypothetical protein Q2K21_08655 [Streptomyces sp. CGMCC 4.7035]